GRQQLRRRCRDAGGDRVALAPRPHPGHAPGAGRPLRPGGVTRMSTAVVTPEQELEDLRRSWAERWPEALAVWSKFTKLSDPRWCLTPEDAKQEGLTESFAMIRLTDQAVVVGLEEIRRRGVGPFAREVLAHEIGHHVYCPGSLLDHGRMIARIRHGL